MVIVMDVSLSIMREVRQHRREDSHQFYFFSIKGATKQTVLFIVLFSLLYRVFYREGILVIVLPPFWTWQTCGKFIMENYSINQHVLIVTTFYQNQSSIPLTMRKLREIFRRNNVPSKRHYLL